MARSIPLTETAKIIRQELKDKFPLTKFSVRSARASMVTSIDITWTDGYTESEVSNIVKRFSCKGEMQIDDYVPYVKDNWHGEEVRWGSDYVNCRRSISEYYQAELDDFFLDYLEPLLKAEVPNYKEDPKRYQPEYLRKYIATVNLHNSDRYAQKVTLEIDRNFIEAYPCPAIAEKLNLAENHKTYVAKIISLEFDPTWVNHPESFLVESWNYQKQIFPDWAFFESQSQPVSVDYSQPQADLTIEGVILEGKIVNFIRANNLQSESLEEICDRFYSPSQESADKEYQVVHNTEINKIQFIFETQPTDYVRHLFTNRGFEDFGTIFQRNLDNMGTYAAEIVIEAL